MTDLIDTVQLQEIDDELVELFDIALPGFDYGDTNGNYYLFAGFDGNTSKISFNGKTYSALPIQITGIETTSSGAQSRPTLTIANIPVLAGNVQDNTVSGTTDTVEPGDIATLDEIRRDAHESYSTYEYDFDFDRNDDLIGTKVVYHKTLKSKLTSGDEFPSQTFYIDRIASENNLFVTFELASPMDVEGAQIPARMVIGRYCPWQYQGVSRGFGGGCTWDTDTAGQHSFFREDDSIIVTDAVLNSAWKGAWDTSTTTSYLVGDIVSYTINSTIQYYEALYPSTVPNANPYYSRRYWKRIDICGKTLNSCKIRFQGNANNTSLDQDQPLPFGGFPGSKKYR